MLNSDKTKYLPRGTFTFAYIDDQIKFFTEDYPEHVKEMYERRICGDMMSGKDFYEEVDCGGIIDYDGILGEVYVNGYKSNLGLFHRGLCQGYFIVDGPTWLDICDEFDVEVEWCNK
jgi:hypothetical protein